ncbi:hypothetical protein NEUTE1DRAFT_51643, partial [Neurospora tetrasperma FGSC 2508]
FILSRFLFTIFSASSPDLHQHPASESAPASSLSTSSLDPHQHDHEQQRGQ